MFSSILTESAADEFDLLKDKWLEMLNGGNGFNISDTDFAAKIKQIQSDANTKHSRLNLAADRTYIFSNHKDPSVSSNVTGTHQSLKSLALAVSTKGCSQYGNTVWKTEIIEALKRLITNNWYNSTKSQGKQGNCNNWWDWEIATTLYDALKAGQIMNDSTITGREYIEKYKQFNSMDRAYLLRQTYGLGISMFSTRIENYESVGSPGNNRKGWHQGDGWMKLANADKTQFTDNYWPTVDSYRLPGTTVEQKTLNMIGINFWKDAEK